MDDSDDNGLIWDRYQSSLTPETQSIISGDSFPHEMDSDAPHEDEIDVREEYKMAEEYEAYQDLPDLIDNLERECWICFMHESESVDARWVTPCRCAGSMKYVHQDCIKRWVEEKQNGNINLDVICPQCQTKYKYIFPDKKLFLRLLNHSDVVIKIGTQFILIAGVGGCIYMVFTYYTRHVFKVMTMDTFSLDGECLTLEPYLTEVMETLKRKRLAIFSSLKLVRPSVISLVVSERSFTHPYLNRSSVWHLNLSDSYIGKKFVKLFVSFYVPTMVLQFRNIKWDEWILKQIDDYQEVKTRYKYATGPNKARSCIGGLLMPFVSRVVGNILYPNEAPLRRWIYGAATYLTVKGGITLIRKYKFRQWIRARQVKDFEGEENNADHENRTSVQVELNGENWIDFHW